MYRTPARSRGFTLVEMLVVIGIVAVLAALLLPAVMMALNAARRAAIVFEVKQLNDAIETYKKDKGDYPPNFRDADAFVRHVRRCYPKIAPTELSYFITQNNGAYQFVQGKALDEGESLVFWLATLRDDQRYPFGVSGGQQSPYKKYYEFDQRRLVDDNGNTYPSFRAKNSGETFYLYIDHRSYDDCAKFTGLGDSQNAYAYAEDSNVAENCARPYWSETPSGSSTATLTRDKFKAVNPTSFQILCAGLDHDLGYKSGDTDVKIFAAGIRYNDEDNDNITNFSDGTLGDKIP